MQSTMTASFVVENMERTLQFYRDVLGFDVTYQVAGQDGKVVHAEVRQGSAGIMFGPIEMVPDVAKAPRGNGVSLYINVGDADIDAYYQQVRAKGATIVDEIQDLFWGDRLFNVQDPDGYTLSFAKTVRQVSAEELEAAMRNTPSPTA